MKELGFIVAAARATGVVLDPVYSVSVLLFMHNTWTIVHHYGHDYLELWLNQGKAARGMVADLQRATAKARCEAQPRAIFVPSLHVSTQISSIFSLLSSLFPPLPSPYLVDSPLPPSPLASPPIPNFSSPLLLLPPIRKIHRLFVWIRAIVLTLHHINSPACGGKRRVLFVHTGGRSLRRDCHFADVPSQSSLKKWEMGVQQNKSPSLLRTATKGLEECSRMTVSPTG